MEVGQQLISALESRHGGRAMSVDECKILRTQRERKRLYKRRQLLEKALLRAMRCRGRLCDATEILCDPPFMLVALTASRRGLVWPHWGHTTVKKASGGTALRPELLLALT